jgi:hypothetical protein
MDLVVALLLDGERFRQWHPRLKFFEMTVSDRGEGLFRASYRHRPFPGVEENGAFEVRPSGDRVLLYHRVSLRGWPVLPLMGWWRIRSRRLWERFVTALSGQGTLR